MKKIIVIIGGGLSGILTAYLLKQKNYSVTILEANSRLGGRILTKKTLGTSTELGATWLWKYNTQLIKLCKELNIKLFPQYMNGDAMFEAIDSKNPQRFTLPKNQEISYRISGGTIEIINRLIANLNSYKVNDNVYSDVEIDKYDWDIRNQIEVETVNYLKENHQYELLGQLWLDAVGKLAFVYEKSIEKETSFKAQDNLDINYFPN